MNITCLRNISIYSEEEEKKTLDSDSDSDSRDCRDIFEGSDGSGLYFHLSSNGCVIIQGDMD